MKRMLFPAAVLLTVGLLFACGGSMSPMQVNNGVPMSVTVGDMPPSGVVRPPSPEPVCSLLIPKNLPSRY